MSVILMTANPRKIAEYRRFLARHAQTLRVEEPTESPETLRTWLRTARAVVSDESNIYDPAGDLVRGDYAGPARNICRLNVWTATGGKLERTAHIREVAGRFDGSKLRPDDPRVFDWDSAFSPIKGVSLHDMESCGLKNSAREQCLSAFVRAFLYRSEPRRLAFTDVAPTGIIDWSADARILTEHPLYRGLPALLGNALRHVVNQGVFFRAAMSRRDGNYWQPGLNGGLPYVPKGDPIHEATYLFHDAMHQLMPDLVFDGVDTPDHRRAYIAYRMMSEAVSLVLADMLFVRSLTEDPAHASYDFTARRIYPLYQALGARDHQNPAGLLRDMTRYVLLGDATGFPVATTAWRRFEEKYSRFFVGDFQWTRMNWSNLLGRADMARRWIELVRPETFRSQGLWLVSDAVESVGRDMPTCTLAQRMFDHVWRYRLAPAFSDQAPIDLEHSRSSGFRRWLTGQVALFARYAPIVPIDPLGHELAARIRDPRSFVAAEMTDIRSRFSAHVRAMADRGLISNDDAAVFPDLFPLFDPFFLSDYDRTKQEFPTVAEASAVALYGGP